jgi:hypothetical protein
MSIAIRFLAGFIVGAEINSAPGVYCNLYCGIFEVAFYNEDKLED